MLPPPVADALRYRFDNLAGPLAGEIRRCCGVGECQSLIRKGRPKSACITLRRPSQGGVDAAEHRLTLARTPEFRTEIPAQMLIPANSGSNLRPLAVRLVSEAAEWKSDADHRMFIAAEFLSHIGEILLRSMVSPLHLPAYYLPADRTGIMHAHSVVVSALIASAPTAGLRPAARTPMLSGVLADFLEQLIEIDRKRSAGRKTKPDFGRNIEKAILDGEVRVDRSTNVDYPRFAYLPHGWKDDLALANASSMVSELAPVVLYLRHRIEPGNVLIVEEPESHLHPAMQVAFTRQLAALVAAGIRVIVTTHSEWLLEELANSCGVRSYPAPNAAMTSRCARTRWALGCSNRGAAPRGRSSRKSASMTPGCTPPVSTQSPVRCTMSGPTSQVASRVDAGNDAVRNSRPIALERRVTD